MTPPPSAELTQSLKALARDERFFLVGAAPAITPPHYDFFCQWLDQGLAGTMEYLPRRRAAYAHPRSILDHARSVLMLGASYYSGPRTTADLLTLPASQASRGKIARYAWSGHDYHDWIHAKLKRLIRTGNGRWPELKLRGVVDTAPLLERDFARLAGLGWVGKNTMLINKRAGSYFFLAAVVLDAELDYDQPHLADHCGHCTRCLEACPTQAFPAPGVLDARRCISYLTIEHQGPVEAELRSGIGDWWFGCDICQDVCPWNRHADPAHSATDHDAGQMDLELTALFA
jgi:epoxyqueuosine reductase